MTKMKTFIHLGPHPDDPDDNETIPEDEYDDNNSFPDDFPYPWVPPPLDDPYWD